MYLVDTIAEIALLSHNHERRRTPLRREIPFLEHPLAYLIFHLIDLWSLLLVFTFIPTAVVVVKG